MIRINRHVLKNGLRLVHHEVRSTQMVALNITYHVGSKDEHPERTGYAHLLEHLMFGGSLHIPDFDTPIQEAGGQNNAWTNNDFTNYYISLPKQNVEIAFWLESDRMISLAFTPRSLEVQRQVVVEEFKQTCLNKPYGDSQHLLRPLLFKHHPYQWPTLGKSMEHIQNAQMDDVKDFFFRFYAPNNAVLAVTGNISFRDAVALTEKWFGSIPARDIPVRSLPLEPQQTEYRRLEVERDVPVDSLYMAFPMCGYNHPDYYAFDILSDLLCNGKSSRLIQQLKHEKAVFSSIDAYIYGSEDPGALIIKGQVLPHISLEQAEQSVFEALAPLSHEQVDEQELAKVQNKFESNQIFSTLNYMNVATNLACSELLGKAEDINYEVEKYRAITSQQIQKVAQESLVKENCCSLHYHSIKKRSATGETSAEEPLL